MMIQVRTLVTFLGTRFGVPIGKMWIRALWAGGHLKNLDLLVDI